VDLGCGVGTWLRVFQEHGIQDVLGIDGDYVDRSALDIAEACFRSTDLSRPLEIERQFDLALCLEVAEHLPQRSAATLVGSLCGSAPLCFFLQRFLSRAVRTM
jgi:2-polyprenyl-3-methyl-5-hydroxy-6-metoxy-1,4-benzoquinol methylase